MPATSKRVPAQSAATTLPFFIASMNSQVLEQSGAAPGTDQGGAATPSCIALANATGAVWREVPRPGLAVDGSTRTGANCGYGSEEKPVSRIRSAPGGIDWHGHCSESGTHMVRYVSKGEPTFSAT
jgi:hypothetical protein